LFDGEVVFKSQPLESLETPNRKFRLCVLAHGQVSFFDLLCGFSKGSDKWFIVVRTDLTRRRESDLHYLEEYPRRTLCAECE